MPKSRPQLLDRVQALEDRVTPTTALSFGDAFDLVAEARSDGDSEDMVLDRVLEADPTLLRRGFIRPAEYSIHDCPMIRLPGKRAARHPNAFVSIVGRLADGGFSVLGADGERHPVLLAEGTPWRSWDPVVVFFLGLLVRHQGAWTMFWSRPKDVRARHGLIGFYVGTAVRRSARYEREEGRDATEEVRRQLRGRIDWILAQEDEPSVLPWMEAAA